MLRNLLLLSSATLLTLGAVAQTQSSVRTSFQVTYVAGDSVYLDAGTNVGLAEGMTLTVNMTRAEAAATKFSDNPDASYQVATLVIEAVADTSAVCKVQGSTRPLAKGDVANLSPEDAQKLVAKNTLGNTRRYPAVVSFSEGDPMDEDVRETIPRPQSPEVNRAVGRIGLDYMGTSSAGPAGIQSSNLGMVVRADITRIAGTHWNLSGYWRGRLQSNSSSSQPTVQDLLNRTYHMSLMYVNPDSKWVAGVGRMYLPYAPSLETIDGGFVGRKVSSIATAGVFAGSTPDPTSWTYDPNRRLAGSFLAFQGGAYERVHYTSTVGFGLSMLHFAIDRPFVFAENSVSLRQDFSVYHSFQVDKPTGDPTQPTVNWGVSRSFLTVHYQPIHRIGFDLNHNYFRDVPTYDPQLVGTGLLDKYLFQGFSGGVRVEGPYRTTYYVNVGSSSSSTDTKSSLNQMYGVTLGQVWRTKIRVDARYSKFDSAFAKGNYRSLSLSRTFGDNFRWELLAGNQTFVSPLTTDNGTRFFGSNIDFSVGSRYFFQGGINVERGALQDYNQWFMTIGYRFDNHQRRKVAVTEPTNVPDPGRLEAANASGK
jgi:hypothetical protein